MILELETSIEITDANYCIHRNGKIAQTFIQGLTNTQWDLVAYDPSAKATSIAEKLGAPLRKIV